MEGKLLLNRIGSAFFALARWSVLMLGGLLLESISSNSMSLAVLAMMSCRG